MRNDWDDDRLLAALGQALKAREAVPSWFIETGKNAFAWHNIDAELAQLTYDSQQDQRAVAVLRSETASIRALTFTSAHLTLELEVTGNSLLGQVLPPRAASWRFRPGRAESARPRWTRSAASRSTPSRTAHSGCAARPPTAPTC